MAEFEVTIQNLPQLQSAMEHFPEIASPILQKAIIATQFVFQKHTLKGDPVPWRSGNLLQSFRFSSSPLEARWFPTARYAPFVQFGTRPHTIVPKRARALAWPVGQTQGQYVTAKSGRRYYRPGTTSGTQFARRVKHPGTRANPFMDKIAASSSEDVSRLFGEAGDLITKEVARQSS